MLGGEPLGRAQGAGAGAGRKAIEAVVADDFHFTSPLDNRIDRKTYFERCWPNGEAMARIEIERIVTDGDHDRGTRAGYRMAVRRRGERSAARHTIKK